MHKTAFKFMKYVTHKDWVDTRIIYAQGIKS